MRLLNVAGTNTSALLLILFCTSTTAAGSQWYSNNWCQPDSQNTSNCDTAIGESVYDLVDHGVDFGLDGSQSSVSVNGVRVSLSAWSDTLPGNDDIVESATAYKISDRWGYGVQNQDWESRYSSVDHAIDNINTRQGNYSDFDFVLFSFDQNVTLSGATFSWIYAENDTQVSVAALSDISGLQSGAQTWSNIVANSLTAASYDIEQCALNIHQTNYRSDMNFTQSAKYWLVGAYNTVFGDIGGRMYNDAFKLTSIGFSMADAQGSDDTNTDSTAVPTPSSLALLFSALCFIGWRKRMQVV